MLYLSEFTFPWADILLRKKDVLVAAQQKGLFIYLIGPTWSWGLGPNSNLDEAGRVSPVSGQFDSEVCGALNLNMET